MSELPLDVVVGGKLKRVATGRHPMCDKISSMPPRLMTAAKRTNKSRGFLPTLGKRPRRGK